MAAKLTRNISYLGLSQAANYIFPLVTIPYITRIVGPSNYGLVEFATVVMLYFVVITDYSFYTTATRKIAAIAHRQDRVSFIFSSVIYAKLLLFLAALLLFTLLVFSIPDLKDHSYLLWVSFPIVLGWALYPNFLFYGIQKLGVMALANVLIKGLAAALIFVFINEKDDFYYVTLINGVTQVGVAILTLAYALRPGEGLRLIPFRRKAVYSVIWDGRFVFLSNFFTRIYGFSSVLIGGFLLSPLQLGLFAAASKLINVAQSFLFQPLHGALFPYLSQKLALSFEEFRKHHKRSSILLGAATLISSILLILLAPWAVQIIFGNEFTEAVVLVQIMAPMLFIGSFAHMHLHQGFLILKKDKTYMSLIIAIGLLSIGLNIWLIPLFYSTGAAWVRLLTEILLAIGAVGLFYFKLAKPDGKG